VQRAAMRNFGDEGEGIGNHGSAGKVRDCK